jgi:hypothetical protein
LPDTLPVEFKGSILVFLCVLRLSRVKPWLRMSSLAFLCYYSLSKGAWEIFLFLVGIILAEMRHIREDAKFRLEHLVKDKEHVRYARRAISECCFLFERRAFRTDSPQIHFGS